MAYIVFIGPPGSGKGTQSKLLSARLGIPQIATGEILRELIGQGTALSRWISARLDRGHFAPDYLVMQMVMDRLHQVDCQAGCLFDGFPRTLPQAEQMDRLLAGTPKYVQQVIELRVDQEQLVERLGQRAKTQSRADDSLPTIMERMRVYNELTAPVLEHYSRSGRLRAVDGLGTVEAVSARIDEALALATGH